MRLRAHEQALWSSEPGLDQEAYWAQIRLNQGGALKAVP